MAKYAKEGNSGQVRGCGGRDSGTAHVAGCRRRSQGHIALSESRASLLAFQRRVLEEAEDERIRCWSA